MKISRDRKARWLIPLLLFFGIIVDAALPAIFPGAFIGSSQIIISHLTLFFIVTFSFYLRDTHILFYSFILGLVYESYIGTVLGVYATIYLLVAYFIIKIKKHFPKKAFINFMLFVVAVSLVDFFVYVFYFELGFTNVYLTTFLVSRLGPTLIFNVVLAFLLYLPMKQILSWLGFEEYIIF